jgi:hypothetical protein
VWCHSQGIPEESDPQKKMDCGGGACGSGEQGLGGGSAAVWGGGGEVAQDTNVLGAMKGVVCVYHN